MSEKKGKRHNKARDLTAKLSKDELLRRLKTLGEELNNADQEDNSKDYDEVASTLTSEFLIKHKDKDVKACVACCCADILRIYAPDSPFNTDQLKSIFLLLVNQLKSLENPESSVFKRAYFILESLAMVKSFNICCEIDAQDIVMKLFKTLFGVINEKHNIKVKTFILDVLSAIIQETESLSQEVVEAVLVNLIDPQKSTKPSSYELAKKLIDRCSTSMEPYLQVFFNDFLVLNNKETDHDMENHIYELILELNKINKTILLSVLPQLEFKLKSQDESERLEVVQVLGKMFSEEGSQLAYSNKPLWKSFLDRFVDINLEVRTECVRIAKEFLISKPDLISDVSERLKERFHDPEEKVRLHAVFAVCDAADKKIEAIPKQLMEAVKERMRDKKWSVRRTALSCLGKLYKRLTIGKDVNVSSVKKISWVPDKVLHSYYQNSVEDRVCVERIAHGCLVPVTLEPEEKMKVLFKLYASLEDYALKAFDGMLKYRSSINNEFKQLLEIHNSETEDKDKLMFKKINTLARSLPEPFKAQENMRKFAAMFDDKKLFELLEISTDISNGCEKIHKSVNEVMKKITSKSPVIDTVKALLDRSSHMLVDSQNLLILLRYVKMSVEGMDEDDDDDDGEDGAKLTHKAKRGLLLLKCLASVLPEIFRRKECYQELLQLIKHQDDFVVETSLRILFHVGEGLETFDRSLCSCFQPVLSKLATNGTREQGIFAVRCLSKMLKDSTAVMDRLLNTLSDSLDYGSPKLITSLASLGEIAFYAPSIFEMKHKHIITEFVVKELLVVDRKQPPVSQGSIDEWGADDEISREVKLKIQGIKLLVKWLLGLQSNHKNAAIPVFRLLDTMLKHDGDLNESKAISPKDKSRLRLAASKALINLVQDANYTDVITVEQYQQLGLTIQDSCYEVRQKFSVKIHKALDVLKLPLDYLAFFMLSATDPAKDRKTQARQMITKNAQTRRDYVKQHSSAAARTYAILPEYSLPYAIYLVSHYPDFDPKKSDSINDAKEYLWFFLEALLGPKADNASFLKKLADNIKQLRDARNSENELQNEKLYVVCDLVSWLLTKKTHTVILKDFPGNPVLPKKLFKPAKQKIKPNTKNYLPVGFQVSPAKAKKPVPLDIKMTSAKEKTPVKAKATPTKRTTRNKSKGKEFRVLARKVTENDVETELDPETTGDADLLGEDDNNYASDDSGDKVPESVRKVRKPSSVGSSPKTKISSKPAKISDDEKSKKTQQKKITELSDAEDEDGTTGQGLEEVLNPLDHTEDVRSPSTKDAIVNETEEETKTETLAKSRSNIRITSGKRNVDSTKETQVEMAIPRKRAKTNKTDMSEEIPLVQDKDKTNEKAETNHSIQETATVNTEEDTSVVLNVRRKTTRRR